MLSRKKHLPQIMSMFALVFRSLAADGKNSPPNGHEQVCSCFSQTLAAVDKNNECTFICVYLLNVNLEKFLHKEKSSNHLYSIRDLFSNDILRIFFSHFYI